MPPKTGVKKLSTKSSTLRRTMEIDLSFLKGFERFWDNKQENSSKIWQILSNRYINRPYLDVPAAFRGAYDITHQGFTIHHRNHDVTHAVRQRLYAQKYLNLVDTYGNAKYRLIAKQVKDDNEIQACLELAIFLCRSGRTNEKSGRDDPSNAKRSAEVFSSVALQLGFNPGLVEFMQFAIATHAPKWDRHAKLIEKLPGDHKLKLAKLLKGIIDLSHHTDLVRCKIGPPKEPVQEPIEEELNEFLDSSKINIKRAATNLLLYATKACKMTGTRVKFRSFSQQDKDNNPALKKQHTQDVAGSIRQLNAIELDVEKISHEGIDGDFEELLRQVALTGKLDLMNWTINEAQLEQIALCISDAKVTYACFLGTKPISSQQALTKLLKEKMVEQKTPIDIVDAPEVDPQLLASFNSQFRQQALDKQKVSMRFEPSRLGRAFSKGAGSFFKQILKEIKGDIPTFGGENCHTSITNIKKLSHPFLEGQYTTTTHHVNESSNFLIKAMQTIQTEDKLAPGEMLLFHGTNIEASPQIMRDGFAETRCKYVQGNGYGPLGKGIYFSSELAKAATFATCSACGQAGQCSCLKPGTDEPTDRVILLCRVFVGKPEMILRKGDIRERTNCADSFDSCIGVSNEVDPISEFRSTEVSVPSGRQVVPLYEIRFSAQPNLLNPEKWLQVIRQNALASDRNVAKLADKSYILLEELQSLRGNSEKFSVIQKKAEHIERTVGLIIKSLRDQQHALKTNPDLNKEQTAKKLQMLSTQLQDLSNFKRQISVFKSQSTDFAPRKKIDATKSSIKSSFSLRRLFSPREYSLKKESKELTAKLNHSPGNSNEFLSSMVQWLNLAIKRDQHKGMTFRVFGTRRYPIHRILVTQELINLRDRLYDLQEKNLSQKEISKEVCRLIEKAVKNMGKYASSNPKIKSSANYRNLCTFLETAMQLMDNMKLSTSVIFTSIDQDDKQPGAQAGIPKIKPPQPDHPRPKQSSDVTYLEKEKHNQDTATPSSISPVAASTVSTDTLLTSSDNDDKKPPEPNYPRGLKMIP